MDNVITDKLTILSEGEATYALREGWKKAFGEYPSLDSLAILWAQTALETGRWKKMHCYNWGNIKHTTNHDYCMYRCSEIINGVNQFFDPPHPQTWFNAYSSSDAGAFEYITFIAARPRYKLAFEQLKAGSAIKYCAALKIAGYFTADLVSYTKGVVSLCEEFKRKSSILLEWKPKEVEVIPVPVVESEPSTEVIEKIPEPTTEIAPTQALEPLPTNQAPSSWIEILLKIISYILGLFTGKKN